jgi:hypothetical protein
VKLVTEELCELADCESTTQDPAGRTPPMDTGNGTAAATISGVVSGGVVALVAAIAFSIYRRRKAVENPAVGAPQDVVKEVPESNPKFADERLSSKPSPKRRTRPPQPPPDPPTDDISSGKLLVALKEAALDADSTFQSAQHSLPEPDAEMPAPPTPDVTGRSRPIADERFWVPEPDEAPFETSHIQVTIDDNSGHWNTPPRVSPRSSGTFMLRMDPSPLESVSQRQLTPRSQNHQRMRLRTRPSNLEDLMAEDLSSTPPGSGSGPSPLVTPVRTRGITDNGLLDL